MERRKDKKLPLLTRRWVPEKAGNFKANKWKQVRSKHFNSQAKVLPAQHLFHRKRKLLLQLLLLHPQRLIPGATRLRLRLLLLRQHLLLLLQTLGVVETRRHQVLGVMPLRLHHLRYQQWNSQILDRCPQQLFLNSIRIIHLPDFRKVFPRFLQRLPLQLQPPLQYLK